MNPDEQEALSIKYNVARIVRLSSGRYALFNPWTNSSGLTLAAIGSLEELTDLIPTEQQCTEHWQSNQSEIAIPDNDGIGRSLLQKLGLVQPFNRRV